MKLQSDKIAMLEKQIVRLEELLKLSQENEGFCLLDRDKYKAATAAGGRIIAHAVEAINEVQSKIGHLSGGSSAFSGSIREAWNINAEFLNSVPEWQEQYLAKVAAEYEYTEAKKKESMT